MYKLAYWADSREFGDTHNLGITFPPHTLLFYTKIIKIKPFIMLQPECQAMISQVNRRATENVQISCGTTIPMYMQ